MDSEASHAAVHVFHSPLSFSSKPFLFLFTFCHKGGVICISEVIDISHDNLYSSVCFFQLKVSIIVWIYLWAFYFVPLIYISVFVPVPYCLDDCVFIVEPGIRQVDSSSSIRLSQDCFGYSRFFVLPYILWNIVCSSSGKNTVGSLIGISVLLENGELFCFRVLVGKPCIIIRAVVFSDTEGKITNIPN